MEARIEKIIIETLKELNEELENEAFLNPNSKTKLYGIDGAMDSLALVSFIADLEEKIYERFGSKHGLNRNQISIKDIAEIAPEDVVDPILKEIL